MADGALPFCRPFRLSILTISGVWLNVRLSKGTRVESILNSDSSSTVTIHQIDRISKAGDSI